MSSTDNEKLACGFIGLGSQGAPIARRMIDAGYPTMLWARRAASLEPYHDTPAQYAETIEQLGAFAMHVGICVVTDDDVREVCERLVPSMREGACIAIHSTIHPDTCRAMADLAQRYGIRLVDAPVSGGSPAAEAGVLTLMLGGEPEAIEQAMPVFETFGKLIVRLGDVGAGQQVKLINNSLLLANLGLVEAALEAGEKLALDRVAFLELLKGSSGRSFALEVRSGMESPATFRHGGALLRKDLRLLTEMLGESSMSVLTMRAAAAPFIVAAGGEGGG